MPEEGTRLVETVLRPCWPQRREMSAEPSAGWSIFPNQQLHTAFMKSTPSIVAEPAPAIQIVVFFVVEL